MAHSKVRHRHLGPTSGTAGRLLHRPMKSVIYQGHQDHTEISNIRI